LLGIKNKTKQNEKQNKKTHMISGENVLLESDVILFLDFQELLNLENDRCPLDHGEIYKREEKNKHNNTTWNFLAIQSCKDSCN
jgi:hypothetical protein